MAAFNWQKLDKFWFFSLLVIFALGFFLRLAWLGEYPTGFHSQEALLGYRGKLLSTGLIDEIGRKLPLIFTSFEGYQWFLPSYLVAFSVKIFGLSEFAVRLPFAFFSCLGLVAFFGLCHHFFPRNQWLAVWALLVLATSPGLILLSRTSSYVTLFLNLTILGFWLFLFLKKRKAFKIIGILSLAAFLLVILMIISYWQTSGWQQDLLHKHLGFLTNPAIINSINRMRGENIIAGKPLLGKLFYNKSFYLIQLIKVFFDHLKPSFYFSTGDKNPLHGLSNFGPLLVVFLPLFLVGVWYLFKKPDLKRIRRWVIIGLILALIPSLLSYPSPNQEKLVLVLPILAILIGYVGSQLKKYQIVLLIILLLMNIGFVIEDAFLKEPIRAQKDWQWGIEELVIKVQSRRGDFDKVLITDEHSPDLGPQLLFYLDYPIDELWQKTNLEKGEVTYRQWINQIDNIKIGQFDNWQINPGEKGLLIVTPEEKEELINYRIKKKQVWLSTAPCFEATDEVRGLDEEVIYLFMKMTNEDCFLTVEEEET
ncbi:hypothetical protein AMJ51_00770 [Microgenomates bacterium DG_75]|nr:MAG: hypothetical protein AMJ51_00770 [Microgenomates bacterium DG_75]